MLSIASGRVEVWIAGGTALTETVALDCLLESARLMAVIVTAVVTLTVGAVKRPTGEIVPAVVNQLAVVLLVLLTVAANCSE